MSTNNEFDPQWLTRISWALDDGALLIAGKEPHSKDGRDFKKLLEACDSDDPQVCRDRYQNIFQVHLLDEEPFLIAFRIYHNACEAVQSGKLGTIIGVKIDPRVFVAWAEQCNYPISSQLGSLRAQVPNAVSELQAHIVELEYQLNEARARLQMLDELADEDGLYYAPELDLALQAYRAARNVQCVSPLRWIERWLGSNHPDGGKTKFRRIATVANWSKAAGRKRIPS